MRKLYVIVLTPLLMALFNTGFSYAAPPLTDHTQHTPLSLMPETLVSASAVKVAAIWWLPDYLGRNSGRGTTDSGGGDIIKDDSDCMKYYGLYADCPSPKVSTGETHPAAGITCQKSCICPAEYHYTSSNCSGNHVLSGSSCDGKYNACVCKPEFKFNSSNCSGEYQPSGNSCGGKYESCTARPCTDGGYSAAPNNDVCTTVSYGGRSCYSCRPYTCSEKCSGYSLNTVCQKGQSKETCSGCADYTRCTGSPCSSGVGSCSYGCKTFSTQSGCTDVCLECKANPCTGYYECGGTWQYCEGSSCAADSSKCSTYCVSDYFPYSCSDSSSCPGLYRNGFCSQECVAEPEPEPGYFCYYQALCREAGGTWLSDKRCSVPCNFWRYRQTDYDCQQIDGQWYVTAIQENQCLTCEGQTVITTWYNRNNNKAICSGILNSGSSTKAECLNKLPVCKNGWESELQSQADRYEIISLNRGWAVTDRHCNASWSSHGD